MSTNKLAKIIVYSIIFIFGVLIVSVPALSQSCTQKRFDSLYKQFVRDCRDPNATICQAVAAERAKVIVMGEIRTGELDLRCKPKRTGR